MDSLSALFFVTRFADHARHVQKSLGALLRFAIIDAYVVYRCMFELVECPGVHLSHSPQPSSGIRRLRSRPQPSTSKRSTDQLSRRCSMTTMGSGCSCLLWTISTTTSRSQSPSTATLPSPATSPTTRRPRSTRASSMSHLLIDAPPLMCPACARVSLFSYNVHTTSSSIWRRIVLGGEVNVAPASSYVRAAHRTRHSTAQLTSPRTGTRGRCSSA